MNLQSWPSLGLRLRISLTRQLRIGPTSRSLTVQLGTALDLQRSRACMHDDDAVASVESELSTDRVRCRFSRQTWPQFIVISWGYVDRSGSRPE